VDCGRYGHGQQRDTRRKCRVADSGSSRAGRGRPTQQMAEGAEGGGERGRKKQHVSCPRGGARSASTTSGETSVGAPASASITERSVCKDCGGTSICEHNRRRNSCKDCSSRPELPLRTHTPKIHESLLHGTQPGTRRCV
jgi:hypothetical protein